MTKLYKLENGVLVDAPNTLGSILNPSEQQLRDFGYKGLIRADEIELKWFQQRIITLSESETDYIEQSSVVALNDLKELYKQKSNDKCDMSIAFGFVFTDNYGNRHQVRATETDQWNYFNSKEPFPCEIKLFEDDYYVFQTQAELDRFRSELELHILTSLKTVCWSEKKAILGLSNQEIYELLLVFDPF